MTSTNVTADVNVEMDGIRVSATVSTAPLVEPGLREDGQRPALGQERTFAARDAASRAAAAVDAALAWSPAPAQSSAWDSSGG